MLSPQHRLGIQKAPNSGLLHEGMPWTTYREFLKLHGALVVGTSVSFIYSENIYQEPTNCQAL